MGILCMSFPVPVFVSHFNYLYNMEKGDCKLKPEELQYLPNVQGYKFSQFKSRRGSFFRIEKSVFLFFLENGLSEKPAILGIHRR